MKEIDRLQNELRLIRMTAGWTAEEFGDKIGVTRQTINNLEMKRNTMTKTQYIAIRAVLDAEIINKQDSESVKANKDKEPDILAYILEVFVDNPEKYDEEKRDELRAKANMLTPSILAKTAPRSEVSKVLAGVAIAMGIVVAGPAAPLFGMAAWLKKVLKKDNETE